VKDRDTLRFILMEKPPTTALKTEFDKDRRDLLASYGNVLGEMYTFKNGKPTARRKIQEFELDKWFLKEDHFRKAGEGFVFFIHTKFLLIDPLSIDPLVCSGSANFSSNSLLQNDENMLLVRGDTRVADIYLTEFDRIFRHFYFRNVANEIEAKGGRAEGAFLDETSKWTDSYFNPNGFKTRRRELFFADPSNSWVTAAGARPAAGTAKPKKKTAKKKAAKKAKPAKKKTASKKTAKKKTARKTAAKKAKKTTKKTARKKTRKKTAKKKTAKKKPAKRR
jgi:phosphatidylserine/phosphatidylglycerophosphate/cardiolipin synthase-like enzyme